MKMKEMIGPQLQYTQTDDVEEVFHHSELVELKPIGLSLAHDLQNPFLMFKDKDEKYTLPVSISPLEAGIFLAQSQTQVLQSVSTPHRFLQQIVQMMGLEIRQCVFVQIQHDCQLVRIYFTGHPGLTSMKLRADEAMSVCFQFQIPIYATKSFIQRSLVMQAKSAALKQGDKDPKVILIQSEQKYLM